MKENNILYKLKISKKLKRQLAAFLEYHPAKRVNRNLREVFMIYIQHIMDTPPSDIDEIIWDMSDLMKLLDVAEDATKHWPEI